jgi:hypothetical protein
MWKTEIIEAEKKQNERIERMDSKGTLSFGFFQDQIYKPTQQEQNQHLKELDAKVRALEIDGKNKQP